MSAPKKYAESPGNQYHATVHESIVYKQDHSKTKGIEPLVAANSHAHRIPLAIRDILERGHKRGLLKNSSLPVEIDAVAVTQGPGMAACLAQGLANAKLLATLWNKPLLYTHHMVAHTLTPLMTSTTPLKFPFLVVLLSGGHTQVVLSSSLTEYKILATTTDNSIGDAFDKVARMLSIDFDWAKTAPGAALEHFARVPPDCKKRKLPIPLKGKSQFSYSGLMVAVQRLVENNPALFSSEEELRYLAHDFQEAAFAQIQDKIHMALAHHSGSPHTIMDIVVSGGVASNQALRHSLSAKFPHLTFHFPPPWLCTDNAAMIAHAGLLLWNPSHDLSQIPYAKWSVEAFAR